MKRLGFAIIIFSLLSTSSLLGYELQKMMKVRVGDTEQFFIHSEAGDLTVSAEAGLEEIQVKAKVVISKVNREKAEQIFNDHIVLTLEKHSDRIELISKYDNSISGSIFGSSAYTDLEVRMPESLSLKVDDGSGDITISGPKNGVQIDDGSGDVNISSVDGKIKIDDGSGDINVKDVVGDLDISDGSGDVNTKEISGNLSVRDGSGDVLIAAVRGDVNLSDGSGDLRVREIQGNVNVEDGSGDVRITKVEKIVNIVDDGSGDLHISEVQGTVNLPNDKKEEKETEREVF
ncbi:MAG: DUF4097 family beta strand repeat-containing protein [Candidatus Marinimicrobia bacterium]|nr:DUF4097 family beta strand repeat-containing protein [Candidatus Neomarinimicrobiota bacterium]MCF7829489.1 DUF4097 family beta strand repeat-containing protein [Candidatus Neomarinimicrobiota bacterium]MCF7880113.1 DUF4097 family beta strand repeat-containing protein [Candidatus Neomarinimicrobiota bacterium]